MRFSCLAWVGLGDYKDSDVAVHQFYEIFGFFPVVLNSSVFCLTLVINKGTVEPVIITDIKKEGPNYGEASLNSSRVQLS